MPTHASMNVATAGMDLTELVAVGRALFHDLVNLLS